MWRYCERSAEYIFGGEQAGDPVLDTIYKALIKGDLTRTQISALFYNHVPARRIDEALATLEQQGKATHREGKTTGRSAEIWSAVKNEQA